SNAARAGAVPTGRTTSSRRLGWTWTPSRATPRREPLAHPLRPETIAQLHNIFSSLRSRRSGERPACRRTIGAAELRARGGSRHVPTSGLSWSAGAPGRGRLSDLPQTGLHDEPATLRLRQRLRPAGAAGAGADARSGAATSAAAAAHRPARRADPRDLPDTTGYTRAKLAPPAGGEGGRGAAQPGDGAGRRAARDASAA